MRLHISGFCQTTFRWHSRTLQNGMLSVDTVRNASGAAGSTAGSYQPNLGRAQCSGSSSHASGAEAAETSRATAGSSDSCRDERSTLYCLEQGAGPKSRPKLLCYELDPHTSLPACAGFSYRKSDAQRYKPHSVNSSLRQSLAWPRWLILPGVSGRTRLLLPQSLFPKQLQLLRCQM
jgi:hypothetical protein